MNTEVTATVVGVGTLLPLLTAVVQQPQWSDKVRTIIGVLVSLIAGAIVYVQSYGLDLSSPSRIIAVAGGIIVAAGAAYRALWKPSGLSSLIESKTSPSAVPADPDDVDDPGEADPPDPDEMHDGLPEEDLAVDLPEPAEELEDASHPSEPKRALTGSSAGGGQA